MTHEEQLSQWHHPPRTLHIAAVKTKRPMMTASIQSTYSALRKLKKCWFWWVNMMTGGSPDTREPRYCQQWDPSNFNDWLISTSWTSGPEVTLTSPCCLETLQHRSTIEFWNIYNSQTCFTTSNLKMFHGNAGNEGNSEHEKSVYNAWAGGEIWLVAQFACYKHEHMWHYKH